MDTGVGLLIGIGLLAALLFKGFDARTIALVEAVVLVIVALESGYGLFRQERDMRSQRESKIRIIARPSSSYLNTRNPAPDEIDIHTVIQLEVWTEVDIDTSALILNLVGVRPRLNLFGKWGIGRVEERLKGLRPKGQDIAVYRKSIRVADGQPFEDFIEFDWRGELNWRLYEDSFMELVLVTERPKGRWRAVVDSRFYERGSTEPA